MDIRGSSILWRSMKIYASHDLNDLVTYFGYRSYMIQGGFANPLMHSLDETTDAVENKITGHQSDTEPRRVRLVDRGEKTLMGGRTKRLVRSLNPGEPFCFTSGDGVADMNLGALIENPAATARPRP